MKFATKPTLYYPSNLRHVATVPWEIIFFSVDVEENAIKLHFIFNRL